jgi:hypothetical protein
MVLHNYTPLWAGSLRLGVNYGLADCRRTLWIFAASLLPVYYGTGVML